MRLKNTRWYVIIGLIIGFVGLVRPASGQLVANSLAELRAYGLTANNSTVSLSSTGGDPHPVTGVVTPGQYWINGDHIADPNNSHPIFMELGGSGNTYDLSAATIKLDTRKLDGFGRNLGHDSGVDVVRISGSNNTVRNLTLIGEDIALDSDPGAQRYADWAAVYVELSGNNNTVDGVDVVTRGSRTDTYGLGDAFGKGASGGIQPFIAHRKASAFRVGEATNAVVNDMHLDVNTFGHGFFVQQSTDTTLTNSTITGELFSTQLVLDRPEYQAYGHTWWGNPIPEGELISGNEGGVRMYTGSSGLTVDSVVVDGMRTGLSTTNGSGVINVNNFEAYNTEAAFNFKNNTTITNSKGNAVNGPLIIVDNASTSNSSIDVELVGDAPINHDYALAYVSGSNVDVNISSDLPSEYFEGKTLFRSGQFFYENWRENNGTTEYDVSGYNHSDSTIVNNTNQLLILGEQATNNTGSSQGPVITNGKNNHYDGITLVPSGMRTTLESNFGLGNNGTEDDGTLETNATIVEPNATLEIQPGIRITDEKLTISGSGTDGKGALYSEGSPDNGTRFGSSSGGDESTIVLDGDAAIGVGVAGNQLLVGRIQGTGNLTKLGPGTLSMEKSSTYTGDFFINEGHVIARPGVVHSNLFVFPGASISAIGGNAINTSGEVIILGTMDLNSRTDDSNVIARLGHLSGSGMVVSSNQFAGSGATLTVSADGGSASFTGTISDNISIIKSGTNTQILGGANSYTGTTTIDGGALVVNGTHTGGGRYEVNGGTLGGTGFIHSDLIVRSGGRLAPGPRAADTLTFDLTAANDGEALVFEMGASIDFVLDDGLTSSTVAVLGSQSEGTTVVFDDSTFSFTDLTDGDLAPGTYTLFDGDANTSFELGTGILLAGLDTYPGSALSISGNDLILSLQSSMNGDFNNDGAYDCADIDTLVAEIAGSSNTPEFDLNGDGSVTSGDVQAWLSEAGEANLGPGRSYLPGDGNLDGVVDASDFNIWNGNKFSSTPAWCSGDYTADGVVDASDFNAWNANKFQSSDVVAVPEPNGTTMMLFALLFVVRRLASRR